MTDPNRTPQARKVTGRPIAAPDWLEQRLADFYDDPANEDRVAPVAEWLAEEAER